MANLHQIALGLVAYSNQNRDYIVPSYNLPWVSGATTNVTGGPQQPLDGWACILDRDRLVPGKEKDTNSIFCCPETLDIEGVKDGQTGTDPAKPMGWTDWPLIMTTVGGDSSPKVAVTIDDRGFTKIIRVSYWINAYNPIGSAPADIASADLFYSASVGLGPDGSGQFIRLHKNSQITKSSRMITLADGVYMGRQSVVRLGDANSRIGYRHPGMGLLRGAANVAFADGHVETITGTCFPRAVSASDSASVQADKRAENLSGPTLYANPDLVFP